MESEERRGPERPPDDWDLIDRLTKRCARAALVGIPTWLVLLAVLNEEFTGIPLPAGFMMASVLALIVVVVVDVAKRTPGQRVRMGLFGRVTIVWVIAFAILALVVSRSGNVGVATVLVPFLGASLVAGFVGFAAVMWRQMGSPPDRRGPR